MTDPQLQQKRLTAAAIDIGILVGFWMVLSIVIVILSCSGVATRIEFLGTFGPPIIGTVMMIAGLGYVVGRDVMAGGRSLGKKMMGIRVITTEGTPVGMIESVKRNALFAPGPAIGVLLALVMLLPGGGCIACLLWPLRVAAGLFSVGAVIWEIVQITQKPDGVRVGDDMAGTRVVF
jgi:uncharacterized RDD family membrane protein YckC